MPPYSCKTCGEVVVTTFALKRHVKYKHPKIEIPCHVCSEVIAFSQYGVHFRQHQSDKSQQRNGRESWDGTAQELCQVEIKEPKSENDGLECSLCKQTYSTKVNLKKHLYNVHRMKRVKCRVCSREVNKKSLRRHIKNVHSPRVAVKKEDIPDSEKIPCEVCGKLCRNAVSLAAHFKNMHEGEKVNCSQCDFVGIKKVLERHIKKEHAEQQVHQCTVCLKVLKSKSTLNEHMWIHSDHRRYICDVCGMRFKRTSNYHGHMKSHEEKKFQCHLCGNYFLRQRYLRVHMETIHDYFANGTRPQEKGFQCEVCGVKLKWKNNLMAHMRIHTGEKPYKCKICGDTFTCHGSLRTHLSKHSICSITPSTASSNVIQVAYNASIKQSSSPPVEYT